MKEHTVKKIRASIGEAVMRLSDLSKIGEVTHAQRAGEPMPSTEKLKTFVEKVRQIIFPGYFGPINFHSTTFPLSHGSTR